MQIRKTITGTPDDFETVAMSAKGLLNPKMTGQNICPSFHMPISASVLRIAPPRNHVSVTLVANAHRGTVEATKRGDGGTELVVSAQDRDWLDLEPVWRALWAELQRLGYASSETKEKRGPKVGTFDRVREAHRLITKTHMTRSQALKQAKTDSRTYYEHCKAATGEDPVLPYE